MEASLEHTNRATMQPSLHRESQSAKAYPSCTILHAKLEMTSPCDHDEREADAMASAIMSGGKISRKISNGASGSSGIAISQQMERQLNHLQGGGRQMPEGLRNMMENGFGQDFSQVRLHTDSEAASMSSSIHAKAFTLGNDIYFNQGQFSPNTSEGQRLVAHELTHVVQGTGKVGRDVDINSYIIDAIKDEKNRKLTDNTPGGYLAYANKYDEKTKVGIGPLRSGGSHNNTGPKCNIFVLNMLYDAYMKYSNKDSNTIRQDFVNFGLYKEKEKEVKGKKQLSYKTKTVSYIYDDIIINKSALKKIERLENVKAGDIVIWTSINGGKSFQEKPYHIEIVTEIYPPKTEPDGNEQKNEPAYVLLSIGAHETGVDLKQRYVGIENRTNYYQKKAINTVYYSYKMDDKGKKSLESPIEFYRFILPN